LYSPGQVSTIRWVSVNEENQSRFLEHASLGSYPLFSARDNLNKLAVRQRIKNLCAYLTTLQEIES
jgi:hypothetical protein